MTNSVANVDTRNPGHFVEGEHILCYEPDPTKVRIIYAAKILAIIDRELPSTVSCSTASTRRSSNAMSAANLRQYLVHFQGWNSSWDRLVSHEFLLKDIPENRQLMTDTARMFSTRGGIDMPPLRRPLREIAIQTNDVDEATASDEQPKLETAPSLEGKSNLKIDIQMSDGLRACLDADFHAVETDPSHNFILAATSTEYTCVDALQAFISYHLAVSIRKYGHELTTLPSSLAAAVSLQGSRVRNKQTKLSRASITDIMACLRQTIPVLKYFVDNIRTMLDFYVEDILCYKTERAYFLRAVKSRQPDRVLRSDRFRWLEELIVSVDNACDSTTTQTSTTPRLASDKARLFQTTSAKQVIHLIGPWSMVEGADADFCLPSEVCRPIFIVRLLHRMPNILIRTDMPQSKWDLIAPLVTSLAMFVEQLIS